MRRSSRNGWLIPAVGGLFFVAIVFGVLSPFFSSRRDGPGYVRVKVLVDSNNYMIALVTYSNVYGVLPYGNNSNVTSALLGNNPEKHIF